MAGGILWGVSLFLWTLAAASSLGWGKELLNLLVGVYPYYTISVSGAFIGLVVGFIDCAIGCALFAWLYNFFSKDSKK